MRRGTSRQLTARIQQTQQTIARLQATLDEARALLTQGDPPAAPSQKPASHRADPASCLVCRRVGGRCQRHGGPSRSTAFRGKGGLGGEQCTRCRWPLGRGHRAGCPAAPA